MTFQTIGTAANAVVSNLRAQRQIEKFDANDRDAWLARRQQDVTASVAGAIMGVHEYETALGLWAKKSGKLPSRIDEESPQLKRGRYLEPVAIEMLQDERPDWQIDASKFYYRDPVARIGATPDAIAVSPHREGFGVVQIKSVAEMIFRQKWRRDDGSIEAPDWIRLQAMIEADLTGASWIAIAPLVVGHGIDLHLIEVDPAPSVVETFREEVAEFWRMVDEGREPDADYGRDSKTISRLYGGGIEGAQIDLSASNDLPMLIGEYETLSTTKSAAEKRMKAIKSEVEHRMGSASVALFQGRVAATKKLVQRRGFTVDPTEYVDFRFKKLA